MEYFSANGSSKCTYIRFIRIIIRVKQFQIMEAILKKSIIKINLFNLFIKILHLESGENTGI